MGDIHLKTRYAVVLCLFMLCCSVGAFAEGGASPVTADGLRQVEQYNFSIHILAMLLVGFGFLMVFVRNYGYSALTGTYLLVATGLRSISC
jgi:ammonium transporter Rh